MLTVPIEIFSIENDNNQAIERAINILNVNQTAFKYELKKDFDLKKLNTEPAIFSDDVYELIDKEIKRIKGYHPHTVCVTNKFLYSKSLTNLFANMQSQNGRLLGKAIVSTFGVEELLPKKPIETYLMFEFLSFAIRFVISKRMIHNNRNFCPFDLKMDKRDIVPIMQYGNFCLPCYSEIRTVLDSNQMNSIRNILGKISDLTYSEKAIEEFESLLDKNSNNEQKTEKSESVKLYDKVVSLIKESETQNAIEIISEYFNRSHPEKYNEIIVHYSRLNKINFESRVGIIAESYKNQEYNKINLALLKLIEFLKE